MSLDAIAKGYIVSKAARRARQVAGVSDVLVNLGGDIQHFGSRDVAIGIANPFNPAENAAPIAIVLIRDEALATSGNYRRAIHANGARHSHIIDPRSGRPATQVTSASVVAPDCATADALSTAFSVLTPSESLALADSLPNVGCLLVNANGSLTASSRWRHRTHDRFEDRT